MHPCTRSGAYVFTGWNLPYKARTESSRMGAPMRADLEGSAEFPVLKHAVTACELLVTESELWDDVIVAL